MPFDLDTTLHPATLARARSVTLGGRELKVVHLNLGALIDVALRSLNLTYPTLTKSELMQSGGHTDELYAVLRAALERQ
jgi:hypothetical protein